MWLASSDGDGGRVERPCLDFIRGRIPSCGPGEGAWCRLTSVSEAVGFSRCQSGTPEAVRD